MFSIHRPKLNFEIVTILIVPFIIIFLLYGIDQKLFENHYDDAYITYRYAANLASGKGLVFNLGEKTNSASSFLFTLLLALFYKLGIRNLEFVSISVNILSICGLSFLVYKSVLSLTKNSYLSIFLSLMTALHGFISGWAVSGMETIFFSFLTMSFIYQYFFQKRKNRVLISMILVLLILARTESLILFFVWFLSELYKVLKGRTERKLFFLQFLIVLIATVSFYVFEYFYYGSFLPHALAFKRVASYYSPDAVKIFIVWVGTSLIVSCLALYALFLIKKINLLFLYLYIFLSFIALGLGPYSDGARYSVHLLPIAYVLAGLSISRLFAKRSLRKIAVILVSLLFIQTLLSTILVRSYMVKLKPTQACRREIGGFVLKNFAGSYVLSGDIGMIAYGALNTKFIDLAGLTSKDVLNKYQKGETIDTVIFEKRPKALADTFILMGGSLNHQILTNQVEYIKGMKVYTNLRFEKVFKNILFKCQNGEKVFAVIDLSSLYEKI